jgi:predicted GNAT superfamily acetyltransferase
MGMVVSLESEDGEVPLRFRKSDGKDLSAFLLDVDVWKSGTLKAVRRELRKLKVDLKPVQRIYGTVGSGQAWQSAKALAKAVGDAADTVGAAGFETLDAYFSKGYFAADLEDLGKAVSTVARTGSKKVRLSLGEPDFE